MSDDQMYHVKLHERGKNWFSNTVLLMMLAAWGGIVFLFFYNTNREPYLVDLNEEKYPAAIDYSTRFEVVVRVETENGVEIRMYDPDTGKLLGTFIEQSSNNNRQIE